MKARAPGIPPSHSLPMLHFSDRIAFFSDAGDVPKTMLEFEFIRGINYGGRFRIFDFNNRQDR